MSEADELASKLARRAVINDGGDVAPVALKGSIYTMFPVWICFVACLEELYASTNFKSSKEVAQRTRTRMTLCVAGILAQGDQGVREDFQDV